MCGFTCGFESRFCHIPLLICANNHDLCEVRALDMRSDVPNLWLCGQDVLMCGLIRGFDSRLCLIPLLVVEDKRPLCQLSSKCLEEKWHN